VHLCYTYTTGLSALPDIYAQARGHVCINQQSMSTCINVVSRSQTAFFLLCVGREKGSGKHSMALLFWQSTDSGDYLEWLLVEQKGLLIGVVFFFIDRAQRTCEHEWLAILWARLIYTNQQAFVLNQKPLKVILRICRLPQQQCHAMFTRPFSPPPTHKRKKRSGHARLMYHIAYAG